jgi:hypothetical protein
MHANVVDSHHSTPPYHSISYHHATPEEPCPAVRKGVSRFAIRSVAMLLLTPQMMLLILVLKEMILLTPQMLLLILVLLEMLVDILETGFTTVSVA